ncbi:anti-sigma factor antagonist [Streptomyces camelliae]|uniref:Anti-sigma factor antagonist n=1 Tax=Streptomyces camelliae TaxID=3004093 RepID=A0ABY7PI64_9ACTN|nr:anti-sigma factor antagonist [Streptomyces sp. HUAS 2-6]WBO68088.1 anti-sigma factor antagonist [Streptomyces sp. HUAS 2-6]
MENGQPSRAHAHPRGPAPLLLQTVHERRPEVGVISVLKARGTVDASNAMEFSEVLAEHIAHADKAGEHPLLDLTEMYLACAAAVRSLDRATGVLAFSGRALPVVQPRPHARDALRTAGLPGVRVHATMASALNALEARRDAVDADLDAGTEPGAAPDVVTTRRRAGP